MTVAPQAQSSERERPVRPVDLLRWPADAGRREDHLAGGRGCLWLVEPGATPPETGPAEDWAWTLTDERDLHARLARLAGRTTAQASGATVSTIAGRLTRNGLSVDLDPLQASIVDQLGARFGQVVGRRELATAGRPGRPLSPRSIDRALHAVRDLIRPLGLEVHTIRGRGVLLDDSIAPVSAATSTPTRSTPFPAAPGCTPA